MSHYDNVRAQLHAIEALMRQHQLWQDNAPQPDAFASTQPFCLDTLAPFEWLQWVLIRVCTRCWKVVTRCPRLCRLSLLRNGAGSDPPGACHDAGGAGKARCAFRR